MWERSLRVHPNCIEQVKTAYRRSEYTSQQDLATDLKVGKDTVYKFFKGKPINRLTFLELCRQLNLEWQEVAVLSADHSSASPLQEQFEEKNTEILLAQEEFQEKGIITSYISTNYPSSVKPERYSLRQLPYCNLPIQTHEFIGRKTELKELLKFISLNYRAPLITVDGIGGVGKTALIVEAAYRCWEAKHGVRKDAPIFDAIIFTSAKENYLWPVGIVPRLQRTSTLSDIWTVIASTLDEPSIHQVASEEQLNRVYQSLSRQNTLLIVDNLETISDRNEVLAFLSDLPPTTKAVITTREQVVIYTFIRLDSLPKEDTLELIQQQATDKGLRLTNDQSIGLYKRFGGVPIALIYVIGQIANSYSLETLLDESTPLPEDVARFCFEGSIQPLRGKPIHKLLMALAIFHYPPIWDAVAEVAGLKADPITVERGLAQLQHMSLVRKQEYRYSMLSLTREYVLAESAAHSEFDKNARERWVKWYMDLAHKYGGEDWEEWRIKYDYLDAERGNLIAVLHWLARQERYFDVKNLWQYLKDYIDIYGYWEERIFWLEWLIQESEHRQDWQTFIEAMSDKGWTLSMTSRHQNLDSVDLILKQAWNLRDYSDLKTQACLALNIAVLRTHKEKDYKEAHRLIDLAENLIKQAVIVEKQLIRYLIFFAFYRGELYFFDGDYEQAKKIFKKILEDTNKISWQRFNNYAQNWLANLAIVQGDLDEAEILLKKGLITAEGNNEKRRIAHYYESLAKLEKSRGNLEQALEWATKALDYFNRLGMKADIEKMRELHNSLVCQ